MRRGIYGTKVNHKDFAFRASFESDPEVMQYRENALSIFTLSLYYRIEDINEFAAQSITEGSDDKKIDIYYLDSNERRVVICQSYFSQEWYKASAPANKASDLNSAIAWLLSASVDQIPQSLLQRAIELRRLLREKEIERIEILYIHNCFESSNVESELKVVAAATRDILRTILREEAASIQISFREIGLNTIEEIYKSRDSEILVDARMEVPSHDFIIEESRGWRAVLTSVPGDWIQHR